MTLCAVTSEPLNSPTRQRTRHTFQSLPTSAALPAAVQRAPTLTHLTWIVFYFFIFFGDQAAPTSSECCARGVSAELTVFMTEIVWLGERGSVKRREQCRSMSPTTSQPLLSRSQTIQASQRAHSADVDKEGAKSVAEKLGTNRFPKRWLLPTCCKFQ